MSSITGSRCLIAYPSCPFWPCRRSEKSQRKSPPNGSCYAASLFQVPGKLQRTRRHAQCLQRNGLDRTVCRERVPLERGFARPAQTGRLPLREHSRSGRRPRRPRLSGRALRPAADKAAPTQRVVTSYLPFHGLPNTNRSLTTKLISEHVAIVRTFDTK